MLMFWIESRYSKWFTLADSRPLVHALYCAREVSDHDLRYLIELHLVCLELFRTPEPVRSR
jgi:hypothetical protein